MIYSDEENQRWWSGLSEYRRTELLQTMIEKSNSNGFVEFCESLLDQLEEGHNLSSKQIAVVRKWDNA